MHLILDWDLVHSMQIFVANPGSLFTISSLHFAFLRQCFVFKTADESLLFHETILGFKSFMSRWWLWWSRAYQMHDCSNASFIQFCCQMLDCSILLLASIYCALVLSEVNNKFLKVVCGWWFSESCKWCVCVSSVYLSVQLFNFANTYRGRYDYSIPLAEKYYQSVSGYDVCTSFPPSWL